MRIVWESDGIGGGRSKTIQQIWDHHNSYQWTYFPDQDKKHIEYFLHRRLSGRNLDVGGGWFLQYPNSDVVDVSPEGLKYNKAPDDRKHLFDLDELSNGRILPFEPRTFDSATFVSSWQYFTNPDLILKELERVMKPAGEIYIINAQNAGLRGVTVGPTHSGDVDNWFRNRGYDTLVECIPDMFGRADVYKSVCVSMSKETGIVDKKQRVRRALRPKRFVDFFADWELGIQREKASQLSTYPVTNHSKEFVKLIDAISKDYEKETGYRPIVFDDAKNQIELDMAVPGKEPFLTATFVSEDPNRDYKKEDLFFEMLAQNGIRLGSRHANYFDQNTFSDIEKQINNLRPTSEEPFHRRLEQSQKLFRFMAGLHVNQFAKDLSDDIRAKMGRHLAPWIMNKEIAKAKRFNIHILLHEYKQRRRVDELIERKAFLDKHPELVVETGRLVVTDTYFEEFKKEMMRHVGTTPVYRIDDKL